MKKFTQTKLKKKTDEDEKEKIIAEQKTKRAATEIHNCISWYESRWWHRIERRVSKYKIKKSSYIFFN